MIENATYYYMICQATAQPLQIIIAIYKLQINTEVQIVTYYNLCVLSSLRMTQMRENMLIDTIDKNSLQQENIEVI
jgi:hypothetical protein